MNKKRRTIMVAITKFTSPSGKAFITMAYDNGVLPMNDPEFAVFKMAVAKYGIERFDVDTLWDDEDDDDMDQAIFEFDGCVDVEQPEYNMAQF
jgi:hypothetical protein